MTTLIGTLGTALLLCGVLSIGAGLLGFVLRVIGSVPVVFAGVLSVLLGGVLGLIGTVFGAVLHWSSWQVWGLALICSALLVTGTLRMGRPARPLR